MALQALEQGHPSDIHHHEGQHTRLFAQWVIHFRRPMVHMRCSALQRGMPGQVCAAVCCLTTCLEMTLCNKVQKHSVDVQHIEM